MTGGFRIDGLSIVYQTEEGPIPAVRNASLAVAPRQTLGLVGESGSGKSTLALGAIGYLAPNGRVTSGTAWLNDTELSALSRAGLRHAWGSRIGLVSQNPQGALNPSLTIGRQLDEMGRRHLGLERGPARSQSLAMLARVDMPDAGSVVHRYPHQLSGGMLQRASIAMALLTGPELLILDEPTTALDVTTQALVLDLLEELKADFNTALLYITHNLGVVARVCDRVAVMYAGEIVEEAKVGDLFSHPLHPYTLNLLDCVPRFATERSGGPLATIAGSLPRLDDLPGGCTFAPRCPIATDHCRATPPPLTRPAEDRAVACWRWEQLLSDDGRRAAISVPYRGAQDDAALDSRHAPVPSVPETGPPTGARLVDVRGVTRVFSARRRGPGTRAVDGVDLWLDAARTLGLVGESGSGKTTVARMVTGLTAPSGGDVLMDGTSLAPEAAARPRSVLQRMQMVFQNPESSLNPRRTVGQSIVRPALILRRLDRQAATRLAYELLDAVRLPASYFHRYPAELSGGEKQRVAIARAFAAAPDLVVCDEPISSLDVSVQGSLMNLLIDLQEEQGTSYLFISHDVAAVQHLSHRIAVMYLGRLMEHGEAARVLKPPYHPYTEALLSAIPVPDPESRRARVRLRAGAQATSVIPRGCRFHPRCPRYLGSICERDDPPWRSPEGHGPKDHAICCHISLDELAALQARERLRRRRDSSRP